ncbi:MAG: elongation factor G [Rhodospirillales bacterium]|nr:elongation factor G [Rhodospirillales bacterium]MBO6788018.1 elongation factor G [Rhodospirillales bacterium]
MTRNHPMPPRAALIAGPYSSGKTSLLEAILVEAGALNRRGAVTDGTSLGDASDEARAHAMSTEMNVASTEYLDESWTFIDVPGSVELHQEMLNAMNVADIAVVVCEPEPDKAVALAPMLRAMDEAGLPHILFINKMDQTRASVQETLEALQASSTRPLVLREVPIRDGDAVSGHVDLVSERAFSWQEGQASKLITLPDTVQDREAEARNDMLESLADFDDTLLEKLLEDVIPETDEVYANLTKDLAENLIVPVFFGSATHGNGVRRLLKALRHEAPSIEETASRLGIDETSEPRMRIFKTVHAGHAGKLSYGRMMRGKLGDGDNLGGARPAGINRVFGQNLDRLQTAVAGDVVGLGKMEDADSGDLLGPDKIVSKAGAEAVLTPLYSLAIRAESRSDDVKLPANLQKIMDEDRSLSTEHDDTTGEYVLLGQGEMHLKLALEKLQNRSGLGVVSSTPKVAYRETIRKPVTKHARHKKQSGGHGEFADVHIDIKPVGRGDGFAFSDTIHGGAVPKQYIPAVEAGAKEALETGPLGFPVVDVSVTLTDGQFHAVDSSEMAFRKAGGQAIREALPEAGPVLLEPINYVTISIPNAYTARIQRIITSHRGQILGFDAKDGWDGWDEVSCQMPAAEMHMLIVEIRSATQGAGTFAAAFDHLQELTGKDADKVVEAHAQAAD